MYTRISICTLTHLHYSVQSLFKASTSHHLSSTCSVLNAMYICTSVFSDCTFPSILQYLKLVPHTISPLYSLDNNVMYLQDGQTPLFIASRKGHIAVVKPLLQMFADVSISKKVCHTLCIVLVMYVYIINGL